MNDTIRMQISAFVDGELPANESELLLRRLSQDAELRQVVARYLEIGRSVRRETELPHMAELRGRIAAALGEEIHVTELSEMKTAGQYAKPVAGVAVAATVALLAIFGLQQANVPAVTNDDASAVNDSYTQPSADRLLDEMFRRHENSPLIERVTFDFEEAELVEVESQANLATEVESDQDIEEDEEDNVQKELQAD